MQEYMDTYLQNRDTIHNFLKHTIENTGDLSRSSKDNFTNLFKLFPSLELIYICDLESKEQVSENIYRNSTDKDQKGRNRAYLLEKTDMSRHETVVSKPYVSIATGNTCITVTKEENGQIFFLDFDLITLLQRLGFVNVHKEFNIISKLFYLSTALIMVVLSIFTVGYALYDFLNSVLIHGNLSIESIFKPVIALTLGLAIFDLAKTIMEQEVVFKSYSKNHTAEYKVLIKFSITIIIALLIESLMIVFKIAIADYSQMIHAFYLIGGVAVLVLTLGLFIYLTSKSKS